MALSSLPNNLPSIYLLPTHLSPEERHELEEKIPTITYNAAEAEVIVGRVQRKTRAGFELRRLKLDFEEVKPASTPSSPRAKRVKTSDAQSTDTDSEATTDHDEATPTPKTGRLDVAARPTIKVVKLDWLLDSFQQGSVLPMAEYLVYEAYKVVAPPTPTTPAKPSPEDISRRVQAETSSRPAHNYSYRSSRRNKEAYRRPASKPPALVKETTSEHDEATRLPPIPDYLHTTYSCQRPTPVHPPNEPFIEELKKIRTTRVLTDDKIGVRAYSTSIASLAAYPYTLSTAAEVSRLPGCGPKIAVLFQEFKLTGKVKEAAEAEADPRLSVIGRFYEIWGVGEHTAREFYNKGWRDLDDVVEYGWGSLSRVQQIGVKYYDEFQDKIPRAEVRAIADVILEHANRLRPGHELVVVGGYRRGKEWSGDVDVVISHADEAATDRLVERLVVSLERDGHITHTLTLSTKNSERGQTPVAWKGNEKRGSGFDTLDKALVVWQDPRREPDAGGAAAAENPNPHRRVDIIVSPWKTAGCAVLGWSSGTTFQRDLRRYCKHERSLKFDSSGVRSRANGAWVDLEDGGKGKAPDMLTAERRVFDGLGLEWRAPEERCTG